MVKFPAGSTTGQPVAISGRQPAGTSTFDRAKNLVMEDAVRTRLGVWAPPYIERPHAHDSRVRQRADARQSASIKSGSRTRTSRTPMVEATTTPSRYAGRRDHERLDDSAVPYGVALDPAHRAGNRMRGLIQPRFALTALAALLASCMRRAASAVSPTPARPAWYRAAPAIVKKGVYIAEYYTNDVLGYDWNTRKNLPPICSLPAAYVVDVATDSAGNLIDPDGGSRTVTVFRGPAMCGTNLEVLRIATVSRRTRLPTMPRRARSTSRTFRRRVEPYGNVSACTLANGCSAVLSNPAIGGQLFSVAEDDDGNVYASGYADSIGFRPRRRRRIGGLDARQGAKARNDSGRIATRRREASSSTNTANSSPSILSRARF